jgi:hypothetical protein
LYNKLKEEKIKVEEEIIKKEFYYNKLEVINKTDEKPNVEDEKHFILNHSIGGPDASFSLDEEQFTKMVNSIREAELSIGDVSYNLTNKQKKGKDFARSLYIVEDIKKGEIFSLHNIKSIRPGFGLHPKYLNQIIGKRSTQALTKGSRLEKSNIENFPEEAVRIVLNGNYGFLEMMNKSKTLEDVFFQVTH